MDYDIKYVIDADVKALKTAVRSVGDDVEAQQKALATFVKKINDAAEKYPEHFKIAAEYAQMLLKTLSEISKQKTPYTLKQQTAVSAGFSAVTGEATKAGRAASAQPEKDRIAAERAYQAELKNTERIQKEAERAAIRDKKAKESAEARHLSGLIRTRYALYDVANESRRVALVTIGVGVAAVKVGADFETAFADVKRTTGLAGTELGALRDSLVEISQTTPVSFKDISAIATLGAQMGITAGTIDEFSGTVAKFSSVTGVAVDSAATSFGRIGELLNVSASGYERLASSVLYAGRNSLATEDQILTLTTQIAASTAQAGFAADEVIGLSTALASLGVAPEQARGVILRLFADFDKVVSENGQTLKDYAALMGTTSSELANMWKTDAPGFFMRFTEALGSTASSAEDMNGILSALGIVETREINVLQRLAGNHDLLVRSMEDAGVAYSENSDLADQYSQKTETLNAKLERLVNNLAAFAASIGEGLGSFLKPIIDLLSTITKVLASSPIVTFIAATATVLSVGAGIFLLYKAAVAQAIASIFAFKTTMTELAKFSGITTISLKNLRVAMAEVGIGGNIMSAGLARANLSLATMRSTAASLGGSLLRFAPQMIAISAAMGIASIATKAFNDELEANSKAIKELAQSGKELETIEFFKKRTGADRKLGLNNFTGELTDFQVAVKNTKQISNEATNALMTIFGLGEFSNLSIAKKQFEEIDNTLTEMAGNGQAELAAQHFAELSIQAGEAGWTTADVAKAMPNYYAAVTSGVGGVKSLSDAQLEAADSATDLAAVIKDRLTESMIGSASKESSLANSIVDFSEALAESRGSISAWSTSGRKALGAFSSMIEEIAATSGNDMTMALTMTAAAINQIEAAGGDATAQVQGLVTRINSMYGLSLNGSTVTSISQLQALIASTGGIAAATRVQIDALLSGGGYADLMKQAFDQAKKSITGTTSAAKKAVRTINDYASDIKSLFGDIYDRAFSLSEATDNFDSSWIDIKTRVDDAKDSVKELQDELTGMEANKGILTYQLGVAERYGDSLRAAKIRAQLLKLDKQITDKTEEKTKAQEQSSMSLVGDTEAAIENRNAIREQVKAAEELIAAYASTVKANGKLPTKTDIAGYAATVVKNFTDQATAIGISGSELEKYTGIITGFGKAAGSVDKPNVKVTLDPVTTAIKAYLAEKKETKVSVTPSTSDTVLDGFYRAIQDYFNKNKVVLNFQAGTLPGTTPAAAPNAYGPTLPLYNNTGLAAATATQRKQLTSYENSLAAAVLLRKNAVKAGSMGGVISADASIKNYEKKIADLKSKYKFATGGYVSGPGTGTSDSISARLSAGEYVIQASAVNRYGVDFMNSLNQMRVGAPVSQRAASQSASTGSSVVYLSPEDRALLRAAVDRPIALYTENTKIAQSANAGNVVLAQRGSN